MGEWAKEGVKCEAQWRREGEEWRGEAIDRTGCVDYMKAKCRCPHDTIRVAGECEGLERGTPRSAVGFVGKIWSCVCMRRRMTVPCRVVASPMVWGKGESRCREGENESWIIVHYPPGAGYDGCMAGCLSVHLFFASSAQTSSSAWDTPPDKKRKRTRI